MSTAPASSAEALSVRQVATEAGVSDRRVRDLQDAGLLTTPLTLDDALLARVGAAIIDSNRPTHTSRLKAKDVVQARNQQALDLVRSLLTRETAVDAAATLMVWPDRVLLAENSMLALGYAQGATEPVLFVPVGAWLDAHRTRVGEGGSLSSGSTARRAA